MWENLHQVSMLLVTIFVSFTLLSIDRIVCEDETSISSEEDLPSPPRSKEYRGYSVYRYIPQNEEQLEVLQLIEKEFATFTAPFDVQFWKSSCCIGGIFDIMLNRKASQTVLEQLELSGMQGELLMPDVHG